MTWDEAAEELAQTLREAIAELELGDYPDDSPEARLLVNLQTAVDAWEASRQ